MTPISPLVASTIENIVANLMNVFLQDKIKDPYARAALEPFMNTFVMGVLQNATSTEMAQQATAQIHPNSYDPTTGQELAGVTPVARQMVADLTPVFEQATLKTRGSTC